MEKYNIMTREIKIVLIILILLAIIYPVTIIVLDIFNYTEIANHLLSISSYLGAVIGSIIGIIGAIYVIFISLAYEEKNRYKNELPKKLRIMDRIKELENDFSLYSYNEGINITDNKIGTALFIYKERFEEFYNNLMDLSIEVDIDLFNECDQLFEEINYIIMLLDNSSDEKNKVANIKLPISIVSNLNLFKSEQTKKIIELSNKKAEEFETETIDEKGSYDLYEISYILNANINHQLRKLMEITNKHKTDLRKDK